MGRALSCVTLDEPPLWGGGQAGMGEEMGSLCAVLGARMLGK